MKNKASNFIVIILLAAVILFSQSMRLFQSLEFQLQDAHYQKGGLVSPEIPC